MVDAMPTLIELQNRLEALKAQRASGIARVTYDGKTVRYRGDAEIAAAIRDLQAQIDRLRGKIPVRQLRFKTSKGY